MKKSFRFILVNSTYLTFTTYIISYKSDIHILWVFVAMTGASILGIVIGVYRMNESIDKALKDVK